MHILLIEPDKILSEIFLKAIESKSEHSVMPVTNAQQAIAAADFKTPDLVILEIQLIEHSGIEFLYEFRSYEEWQSIPVIIHSIVPFMEFIDNWELLQSELGVNAYLYKPHTNIQGLLGNIHEFSLIST